MKHWIPVQHKNNRPDPDQWVLVRVDHRQNPQDLQWAEMDLTCKGGKTPIEYITVAQLWRSDNEENWPTWCQGFLASGSPIGVLKNVVEWQELPDLPVWHSAVEPWSAFDTCTPITYDV